MCFRPIKGLDFQLDKGFIEYFQPLAMPTVSASTRPSVCIFGDTVDGKMCGQCRNAYLKSIADSESSCALVRLKPLFQVGAQLTTFEFLLFFLQNLQSGNTVPPVKCDTTKTDCRIHPCLARNPTVRLACTRIQNALAFTKLSKSIWLAQSSIQKHFDQLSQNSETRTTMGTDLYFTLLIVHRQRATKSEKFTTCSTFQTLRQLDNHFEVPPPLPSRVART
jgi:hypothetical protein